MPFYEYECSSCKFYTEVMQKITDAPLRKCPSCGKSTLRKLVSAPVFRLKGSGWYETDFKSDKENRRNLADADREPAKESSTDTATESKSTESRAAESASGESKSAGSARSRRSVAVSRKSTARAAPKRARPKVKARARPAKKARR